MLIRARAFHIYIAVRWPLPQAAPPPGGPHPRRALPLPGLRPFGPCPMR
jgi:hypothetical protein